MPLQTGGACQIDHCLQTTLILAGQAFDLEAIESMSAAFVAACDGLHLEIGDPAARFVAEKVIALAQRGIRDPNVLRAMTLKELGLRDEGRQRSQLKEQAHHG